MPSHRLVELLREVLWSAEKRIVWPITDSRRSLGARLGALAAVTAAILALLAGAMLIGVLPGPIGGSDDEGDRSQAIGVAPPAPPEAAAAARRYAEIWAEHAAGREDAAAAGELESVATPQAAATLLAEAPRRGRAFAQATVAEMTTQETEVGASAQVRISSPRRDTSLRMLLTEDGSDWLVSTARHEPLP